MKLYRKTMTFIRINYKRMIFINFILCGIARAATLMMPFPKISRRLGARWKMFALSSIPSSTQLSKAILIQKSIKLTARYTPWNSNCLTQAMVAQWWCRYYHIPYFLFIGLAKQSEKPIGEEGHAWLTVGPIAVTGGNGFASHHIISTFSNMEIPSSVVPIKS